jgi:hypothetical protein
LRASQTLSPVVKRDVLTGSDGALWQVERDFDLRSIDTELAALIDLPVTYFCCAVGVGFWRIDEPVGVRRDKAIGHEIRFQLCDNEGVGRGEFFHDVPRTRVCASASANAESLTLAEGEKSQSIVLTDFVSKAVNDWAGLAFEVTA